jgi:hypothetical protein
VIKSRIMRWAGHVARITTRKCAYGVLWRNVKERAHLEDLGIDKRVILKCSFEKWVGESMNWNGLAQDSDR